MIGFLFVQLRRLEEKREKKARKKEERNKRREEEKREKEVCALGHPMCLAIGG